ncbi:MAG: F0F1 ATP synthase subunit A [Planctomycetota bacterium]
MNEPVLIPLFGLEVPDVYLTTLGVTLLVGVVSYVTGRSLAAGRLTLWQTAVEAFLGWIEDTVREVVDEDPTPYVPLIASLMVFIAVCDLLAVVPVLRPPTAELATTVALALVVFVAVPIYGVRRLGLWGYLKGYARPSPLLIPFNLLGELTRTLALAVRLFGNVMSGVTIGAVILALAGLFVPLPLLFLSILTGLVQAYIFGILAAVYIAAALQVERRHPAPETPQ